MRLFLKHKYQRLFPKLNEYTRRLVAAADIDALGYGGISLVAEGSKLSRPTLYKAMEELKRPGAMPERVRKPGGGRKSAMERYPKLAEKLEALVEPSSRGDPMSPLRWTIKSTRTLSDALKTRGIVVSHRVVAEVLDSLDYSLQANAKTLEEGRQHPDRDAQFNHINRKVARFMREDQPVISVDTKKKELIGSYKNGGREWKPKGKPEKVRIHDFPDPGQPKAIPYGVYDVTYNRGWVNVGRDHDTASFAVESIGRWWKAMGQSLYPQARGLLICADSGGSNGWRVRLWKKELQHLSNKLSLEIAICHFPPGTSKWNKIEHRLFSQISLNWRGRPLTSHEVVIQLIASTTTKTGLKVGAQADTNRYPKKVKVSDEEMAALNLVKDKFHGEWNYTLKPQGKI